MKKLSREIVFETILIFLCCICIVLLPVERSKSFWVSFFFSIASLVIYCIDLQMNKKSSGDKFLGLAQPIYCFIIVVLQLLWNGFVFLTDFFRIGNLIDMQKNSLLENTIFADAPIESALEIVSYITKVDILEIKVIDISVPVNAIVNIFLVMLFVLIRYYTSWGKSEIEKVQRDNKKAMSFKNEMMSMLTDLLKINSNSSMRKKIVELQDTVSFSDPISSNGSELVENEIINNMKYVKKLLMENNESDANINIKKISTLLNDRNDICKNTK